MRPQQFFTGILVGLALVAGSLPVQAQTGLLTGTVSSVEEGMMEGVLVSAKALGSTITLTVVSNAQGSYAFPAGRLQPGRYRLTTRAAGYDLVEPGVVVLENSAPAKLDLKLQKTRNLPAQMMNAEWQFSLPGTPVQKAQFAGCVGCHSLTTPVSTRYDAQQFAQVLRRMSGYSTGSGLLRPTMSYNRRMNPVGTEPVDEETPQFANAAYLASINLSQHPTGERPYPLKTFPRPTGRATQVIITEYDLPRPEMQPHDVMTDAQGYAWFGDFGDNVLSRLDPKTGEIKQWRWPLLRDEQPAGNLDLRVDAKNGAIWMGLLRQGGLAKFDMKTETFESFEIPASDGPGTNAGQVVLSWDGNMVWMKSSPDRSVHGFDIKQNRFTKVWKIPHDVMYYGMTVNQDDILFLYGIDAHTIGELDLKTGSFVEYPTPTNPSAPRRGDMDTQGRPWFAFNTSPAGVGMYDPKTNEITEYWFDTPYDELYDATVDKRSGHVYAGGMLSDYVYRLDPSTGDYVKYLLPTVNVNIRRMHSDISSTRTHVWIGYNHQAKVAMMEPLD